MRTGNNASVRAGNGDVTVVAEGGHDMVQAGTGDDFIFLLDGPNAGFSAVLLGNGNNHVFLTGAHNTVMGGSGSDTIQASGSGNDVFVLNAAGSDTTIYGFQSTDHIDLSGLLAGNTTGIVMTLQADARFGAGAVDTVITATGASATGHVTLANYDGGSVAMMLSQGVLAA